VDAPTRPCGMTLAEFEKFVVDETAKWANVIRAANSRRNRARRCRRDIPYFPIREPTLHHNNALRAGGLLQCINLRSGESATGHVRPWHHIAANGSLSLDSVRAGRMPPTVKEGHKAEVLREHGFRP
jgi:hypothetical protein